MSTCASRVLLVAMVSAVPLGLCIGPASVAHELARQLELSVQAKEELLGRVQQAAEPVFTSSHVVDLPSVEADDETENSEASLRREQARRDAAERLRAQEKSHQQHIHDVAAQEAAATTAAAAAATAAAAAAAAVAAVAAAPVAVPVEEAEAAAVTRREAVGVEAQANAIPAATVAGKVTASEAAAAADDPTHVDRAHSDTRRARRAPVDTPVRIRREL
eukprot:COSAG03_NODE_2240_length_2965_cov_86.498255_3_plen_218_part_01